MAGRPQCQYPWCPNPAEVNPRTNQYYDFCCRAHAAAAKTRATGTALPECALKGCSNPVYVDRDSGEQFEFCCRSHATLAPTCALHGCTRKVYKEFLCCSRSHGRELNDARRNLGCLVEGCRGPNSIDSLGTVRLCCAAHKGNFVCPVGDCERDLKLTDEGTVETFCSMEHSGSARVSWKPMVLRLTPQHSEYTKVKNQFLAKWAHPNKTMPAIKAIYQCFNCDLAKRFDRYVGDVERCHPNERATQYAGTGNSLRRFHGTSLACGLGTTTNCLCMNPNCTVCRIIKVGFQKQRANSRNAAGFLRYGVGIYTSSTSSKAYDYGNQKAVFIANVAAGRSFTAKQDMLDIVAPPPGYDSVTAIPGKTDMINYDELVVYHNNAAVPLFLIVFD